MKKLNYGVFALLSICVISCGGGSGSTTATESQPASNPTISYTTVYSGFNSGNPLTGSANSIQNTINPVNNEPIYQLNSVNYGNNALVLNNNNWSIMPFGNGTIVNQNLVLDSNGNVDQANIGSLIIYNPSDWAIVESLSFDSAVNLTYGVINSAGNIIYGYGNAGAYSCPVNGGNGSCTLLVELSSQPKRIQYVNNILYGDMVATNGDNILYAINTITGNLSQYTLNIPEAFQVDEFAPDPSNSGVVYFNGIKPNTIYMSIFKCTISSNSCADIYDNITSTTDVFSKISADSNYLYFLHTHTSLPTISYSIVQVSK